MNIKNVNEFKNGTLLPSFCFLFWSALFQSEPIKWNLLALKNTPLYKERIVDFNQPGSSYMWLNDLTYLTFHKNGINKFNHIAGNLLSKNIWNELPSFFFLNLTPVYSNAYLPGYEFKELVTEKVVRFKPTLVWTFLVQLLLLG